MDERDRHRALADRARDALDRARAHVAGDEHAGDARLQQVGVARQRPAVPRDVGPGEDEAALVALDDAGEPVGARRGADEDEARVDVQRRLGAVAVAFCLLFANGAAVIAAPTAPGDSSTVLGINPTFLNGYVTNANGEWYKTITDSTASTRPRLSWGVTSGTREVRT